MKRNRLFKKLNLISQEKVCFSACGFFFLIVSYYVVEKQKKKKRKQLKTFRFYTCEFGLEAFSLLVPLFSFFALVAKKKFFVLFFAEISSKTRRNTPYFAQFSLNFPCARDLSRSACERCCSNECPLVYYEFTYPQLRTIAWLNSTNHLSTSRDTKTETAILTWTTERKGPERP